MITDAAKVQSRSDFVAFLKGYREDLAQYPDKWEHISLSSFLESMAAWVEDMDGYYLNQNQPIPDQPTWKVLAEIFIAARIYE